MHRRYLKSKSKQLALRSELEKSELERKNNNTTCTVEGCKAKPTPPTSFCFAHILHDVNQTLFTKCSFVGNSGSACNYPVLIAQTPQFCAGHLDVMNSSAGILDTTKPKKERKRKAAASLTTPLQTPAFTTQFPGLLNTHEKNSKPESDTKNTR